MSYSGITFIGFKCDWVTGVCGCVLGRASGHYNGCCELVVKRNGLNQRRRWEGGK